MFEAFEEDIRVIAAGEHPIITPDWLNDDFSVLSTIDAEYAEDIDIKLLHAIGGHLAEVVRGNEQLLEVITKDDMLNRFYMESYASIPTNKFVGDVMKHLTFKYPRAKVLEIGDSTGMSGVGPSILFYNADETFAHVVTSELEAIQLQHQFATSLTGTPAE
ncbi:hypothetical protein FCULG_00010959 [Fusarium culmorum]|uniref:Uncharacterized protein n=1 Tax=Fusarium culmorum TaxID=5516 RepID=A0A2T4GYT9_FUSCU|nr:hypothetical protein FCULG_00010959 [Fusarium culmorum]